jgi:membrane-associated phospholipid phosphatase
MNPILLLLLITAAAAAQNIANENNLRDKNPQVLSAPQFSPFEITKSKDLPFLCAGIASAAAGLALERSIPPLTQQEIDGLSRNSVNAFDRPATYRYSTNIDRLSDVLVDAVLLAPLGFFADRNIRTTATTFSAMYAEVVLFAYAFPSLGKSFYKRPRPFVYNPDAPADEKLSRDARVSFFSRHTTFAFASACFSSTVYGVYNPESKLKPYFWAGGLITASIVGCMRYESGAHFPTDILTGALAGTLIGCGVPLLHKTNNPAVHVSINPFSNALCLSIDWRASGR